MVNPITDEDLSMLDEEIEERVRDDDKYLDGISTHSYLELRERLHRVEYRVETLFDALKDAMSPEFHPWLKAKIEEHFK